MKIAMVGQFPPHIGGVGVHIHRLAKELVKKGHEVYVITYPHKDLKDIDGIHVIGTKGLNIPGIRGLLFEINAKKALKELVEKEDIDIIHGHYLFPAGKVAVDVANKKGITSYVTAHGSDMFEMYNKQKFMRRTIKNVLKKSDHVLAVSNALKDEIIATNVKGIKEKTKVYWNSIDLDKFKEYNKLILKNDLNLDDKPIVLFVGNIIKRKNVNGLLEAKKLSEKDYNLVIVGDGPLLKSLKEKTIKEEIDDVYFTGARNDVEKIIPSCDLLILPSFTESFGLVLIEALACNKAIIGSNVGGIKEIITNDVGILIDPNDYNDISLAIENILTDKDLKEKFESNARKRAEKFSKVENPYK